MEIVKEATVVANEEIIKEPVIDEILVAKLTEELAAFEKELENKVYPIKLENEKFPGLFNYLKDFVQNHASWKDSEALGVIEAMKLLEKETMKNGNIFLKSLAIQAIRYFLSKVEGKGLEHAEKHIALVKPIDAALALQKLDDTKLNQMRTELAATEQGISIEPPVKKEE